MNNNYYDIPSNWYQQFNNTFNTNNNLTTAKEGFLKGNLFNNLYDPYKNYKYQDLKAKNQREELLYNILKYNFALIELDLYLDTNPTNQEYLKLYQEYLTEKKKLCNQYENTYGPLSLGEIKNTNYFDWIKSPWPWEVTK